MSEHSSIEWTDASWNPVFGGCHPYSPGCDFCYARAFAERFRSVPGHHFENGFDLTFRPDKLDAPLHWKKPRKIFVCSMGDLFFEGVPLPYIQQVFATMEAASWHTFQVLVKRAARLHELAPHLPWPPNVWAGVTVEAARYAYRATYLANVPAAVRFLSVEPLLTPIPALPLANIDWVIVGGESGPHARPIQADWVRDIRDQCLRCNVPFFFKQWGGRRGKRSGDAALLDGRLWRQFPHIPSFATGANADGGRP